MMPAKLRFRKRADSFRGPRVLQEPMLSLNVRPPAPTVTWSDVVRIAVPSLWIWRISAAGGVGDVK